MHYSWSHDRYLHVFNEVQVKWNTYANNGKFGMKKFHDYFNKKFISSSFTLWQIYLTPPGFASTRSPIESFNKDIKATFTDYIN